ncbi:DUF4382 domain-containing protein [Photobacterium sagamiensis]|uniref:DUF4382 domain-containing protein n=1 Tax=Photobacterium sagamiensis TaxID=2910241 RepID=UPI003D1491AE
MKKIILMVLTMFVVAGCGGSSGDSVTLAADPEVVDSTSATDGGTDPGGTVPGDTDPETGLLTVDIAQTPVQEAPALQVCVAIDGMEVTKADETITVSMEQAVSSDECIPPLFSVPLGDDGNPLFIVVNLVDLVDDGTDTVRLISEQLLPAGEYSSLTLSMYDPDDQGYGDIMHTPYSYVRDLSGDDPKQLNIAGEQLTFDDGFTVNPGEKNTYTIAFDLHSILQLKVEGENKFYEMANEMINEGMRLVDNLLSGVIHGIINPSACASSLDDAYVYLYHADTAFHHDLGSDYPPVLSAKVKVIDSDYKMKFVPYGNYDLTLVCNGSADTPDIPDQFLDIDLSVHMDQKLDSTDLDLDFH